MIRKMIRYIFYKFAHDPKLDYKINSNFNYKPDKLPNSVWHYREELINAGRNIEGEIDLAGREPICSHETRTQWECSHHRKERAELYQSGTEELLSILYDALIKLRKQTWPLNLPWKIPFNSSKNTLEWFCAGGHGQEKARFLLCFDDGYVWASVITGPGLNIDYKYEEMRENFIEGYKLYLQLNGW